MRSYQGIDISVYRDTAERANMLRIHTFLQDASRALSANVVVTSSSVGAAPSNAAYLTIGNDASLSAERAIVTTSPLTATDGGANSSWTLSLTASALDHGSLGGLADDDHPQYLLLNAPLPLGTAWDAGNIAIMLGAIVGKSGTLTIAPTAGQIIAFQSGIAETVITINPNSGGLFTAAFPASSSNFSSVLTFAGTTTSIGNAVGINVSLTDTAVNTGTTNTRAGISSLLQYNGTSAGVNPALNFRNVVGLRSLLSISGASTDLGIRTSDFAKGAVIAFGISGTLVNTLNDFGGLVIVDHTNPTAATVARYAGLMISRKNANITATVGVGAHVQGNVQIEAGDRLVFDGTATVTTGTTANVGRCSALTAGDSYMTYSVANTQVDLFVDAAQAFHFDAGGAAGTSRCYGNLLVSGTTTSTGLLTASAALTITTGNLTVTAGNLTVTAGTGQFGGLLTADVGMTATTGDITATAGNITTVAGDIISGSDLALAGGSWLKFDGTTNNAMILSGGNLSLFLGGSQEYIFTTSSFLLASGNTIAIDTNKLILAEAQFTHAPTSAAIFTMSMKDAVLLTTTQTATTRTLFDVLWGVAASTGVRALASVRDNTNTYFNIESQRGITQLSKYANSAEWLARGMADLAGDEWVWDFNTDAGAVFTTGGLVRYRFNGATAATMTELGYLDCSSDVRASQLVADGDTGGVASTVTFTKTNTAVSGVTPAVLATTGGGPAGATQSHWLKIYDGTTARYIPVWT